jgi:protein TonB
MAHGNAALSGFDEPWRRLPLLTVLALALWGGVLVVFGLALKSTRPPTVPEAVDVRIVEMPPKGLAGGGGGTLSTQTQSKPKPAIAAAPIESRPKPLRAARSRQVASNSHKTALQHIPKPKVPLPPIVSAPGSNAALYREVKPVPSSNVAAATISGTTIQHGVGSGNGAGRGNGVGEGAGSGSGGGFGTGGNGPQAIYAPVPSIPDDMRDEVLEAVAVARFSVSHDGSAVVSLSKPTEFSRLNNVILKTLRKWRFHPASRNGVAIDSDAEVRLLITVQ